MTARYSRVARRAANRCEYCHAPEVAFNLPFEVEHIVPRSGGGSDEEDNLALACRSCNLHKAAFQSEVDPETQAAVRLFHPREEDWGEHFRFVADRAFIEGVTPIGRATIVRLDMNNPAQLAARRQWVRLGLFP